MDIQPILRIVLLSAAATTVLYVLLVGILCMVAVVTKSATRRETCVLILRILLLRGAGQDPVMPMPPETVAPPVSAIPAPLTPEQVLTAAISSTALPVTGQTAAAFPGAEAPAPEVTP